MRKIFIGVSLLLVMALTTSNVNAQSTPSIPPLSRVEAVVTKVIEDSVVIEETGNKHPYQKLQMLGLTGSYKGKSFQVENGKYDQSGIVEYKTGDMVVISVNKNDRGSTNLTITDFVRRTPLYILFGIFVVLAVIIGGKRGASSLLGMGVTFAVLFLVVLPQVLAGANPVTVTIIASIFIVPVTFFLSHGVNKKTICAIAGTFVALVLTGFLAGVFVDASHLTGFASEESNYLVIARNGAIDIHGLLLSGIIIGLLGVLQDITVSQAAIVFQLKQANSKFTFLKLFTGAMDVGRDHIASMANTLVLVYAGASLPLLLLFINNPLPFSQVINSEIIAEEIVRTLVSSIGLVVAVPITTALTALLVEMRSQKPKA